MKTLDKNRLPCPKCGAELRAMKDEGRVLTYISFPGCGATFDPDYLIDLKHERQVFILRERNPQYLGDLPDVWTADSLEQLLRDAETGEQYLGSYPIGWRRLGEAEWLVWPPDA